MKTFLALGLLMGSSLICFGADHEIQGDFDQVVSLEKEFKEESWDDIKAAEEVVTKIKELESQDKNKQDIQGDVELYMNQLPMGQKINLMLWLPDQPLADETKMALLSVLQHKGVIYTKARTREPDAFKKIFAESSFIERMKMAMWLDNPPVADEKDEEVVLRRFLYTDKLKEQGDNNELILTEGGAYFEAQPLDDQFRILHWMTNPPAPKESEMDVIAILESQYEAMKEEALSPQDLHQKWNSHIWQLSSRERMINYKWTKNKQKENQSTQSQNENDEEGSKIS